MSNYSTVKYEQKSCIYVTFELEGFHAWLDAPDEVAFLRHEHRHLFKYKVAISVVHNDRDIEFFLFKNELVKACTDGTINLQGSCEMRAEVISGYLLFKYPGRAFTVEVSEDGENGAICSITPFGPR